MYFKVVPTIFLHASSEDLKPNLVDLPVQPWGLDRKAEVAHVRAEPEKIQEVLFVLHI